jgi:hypothetical protein
MEDSTITNPYPIASVQESSPPVLPTTLGQSNEEIIAGMMSSERGDSSDFLGLFLNETQPVVPYALPARIKKTTHLLFPEPVSVIAGQRRGPPRAARAPASMLSEDLQRQKINKV